MMCLLASYKKKNMKKIFFGILKIMKKKSDPELDPDPDQHQNVTDP